MQTIKTGFLIHIKYPNNGESLIYIDTPIKQNDKSALYTQLCHIENLNNEINVYTEFESGSIKLEICKYASDKELVKVIKAIAKYTPESYETWKKNIELLELLDKSEKKRIFSLAQKIKPLKPKLQLLVKKVRTKDSIKEFGETKYWAFEDISIANESNLCKPIFFKEKSKKNELKALQCYPVYLSFDYIVSIGRTIMSKKLRDFLSQISINIDSKPLKIVDFSGKKIKHDYELCPINWAQPIIEAIDKERVDITYPYGSLPFYKEFYFNKEVIKSNLPVFIDSITYKKFIRDDVRKELSKQGITGFAYLHPRRLRSDDYLFYDD